jgi:hypothetical protein
MLTYPQFVECEINCIVRIIHDFNMCTPNEEQERYTDNKKLRDEVKREIF